MMSELQIGFVLLIATFVVLLIGVPVGFGLILLALVFLLIFGGAEAVVTLPSIFVGELSNFALLTLPLFVLLGAAIGSSRAGRDLYVALHRWLVRVPGGLVIANLAGCGLFSAMCGSSAATAAAIGKIGIPEMMARNVPARLAAGGIAAGGTLGILIPPSLTMIVYGVITHTSIARLFLAGVIPGITLLACFMLYAWTRSVYYERNEPNLVKERYSLKEKVNGSIRSLPFLAIIAAVTVFMYTGVATPSEVAAIAAFLTLVLVVLMYRTYKLQDLWLIWRETVSESTMILMIVGGAAVYAYMMSFLYITQSTAEWVFGWGLAHWELILMLNIFLLIAGFFLPAVSVILMSMPVILPILTSNSIDVVWFAVIMTVNLEIGLIHPPLGLNLFVIQGVAPQLKLKDIMLGPLPFIGIMIGAIVLFTVFPGVVTWLPDALMGKAV